jgi:hypothetical protein
MTKYAKDILDLIEEDFALCDTNREQVEAKAIFRLLNFCPSNLSPAVDISHESVSDEE